MIGSDLDIDLVSSLESTTSGIASRHSRFIRKDGSNQQGKTIWTNFEYYGLTERVHSLLRCDAMDWLSVTSSSSNQTLMTDLKVSLCLSIMYIE